MFYIFSLARSLISITFDSYIPTHPLLSIQPLHLPAACQALAVGSEQFEVIELCKIFLGKQVARLYTLIMAVYMYCSLWAYSTVFANSLSARLPVMSFFSDGKDGYSTVTAAEDGGLSFSVYLLVFAMITVPTSMLELSEQVFVQVALSICRVMMLLVMIVTIVLAPIQQQYTTTVLGGDTTQIFGPLTPPLKPLSPQPSVATWSSLESFHLNKIYLMLPMAGFAFIFHHSIPAISHPVKNKNALGTLTYTTSYNHFNTPFEYSLEYILSTHPISHTCHTLITHFLTSTRLDLHNRFVGLFRGLHSVGLHCLFIFR